MLSGQNKIFFGIQDLLLRVKQEAIGDLPRHPLKSTPTQLYHKR